MTDQIEIEKPVRKARLGTGTNPKKGYCVRATSGQHKGRVYYVSDVQTILQLKDDDLSWLPEKDPRTLVYICESERPEDKHFSEAPGLFFESTLDAEDLMTMLVTYQDYDAKLCGPFGKDCKFKFDVVEIEVDNGDYNDLQKDFLDKFNHMDFNKEMDAAKEFLDKRPREDKECSEPSSVTS